jgi:hypothetical protein
LPLEAVDAKVAAYLGTFYLLRDAVEQISAMQAESIQGQEDVAERCR